MTNFRYSQNPRAARKRSSRTSHTSTRRNVSNNRYRGQSEIRRSARRNRRANHKRARDPREIGLTSFEPMPYGYERWNGSVWLDSWVDQYNSELERIETMFNDGYDVTNLVNGLYNLADTFDYNAKTSHRANRRRPHTPHRASRPVRRIATTSELWTDWGASVFERVLNSDGSETFYELIFNGYSLSPEMAVAEGIKSPQDPRLSRGSVWPAETITDAKPWGGTADQYGVNEYIKYEKENGNPRFSNLLTERHSANRKRAKEELYFAALNSSGEMVEITAKPYGDGYIWSYQGPDYNDYDQALISLPIEESYSLFLEDMGLTKGDYPGPEMYTANRRANRRRSHHTRHSASRKRSMNSYDVQTVADSIFEFDFDGSQNKFYDLYEADTNLVYEVIENYLREMGYEYDDYDVTEIASFIADGNSDW